MHSQVNLIGNPLSIGGLDGRRKRRTPCETWSWVETAKSEPMQLTKTSIMASKRTFVGWIILVGAGLFWNGRIRGRRRIILVVRVLRRRSTVSVVVALCVALIIGTWTRVVVCGIGWGLVTWATSSTAVTASSARATPITAESVGPL